MSARALQLEARRGGSGPTGARDLAGALRVGPGDTVDVLAQGGLHVLQGGVSTATGDFVVDATTLDATALDTTATADTTYICLPTSQPSTTFMVTPSQGVAVVVELPPAAAIVGKTFRFVIGAVSSHSIAPVSIQANATDAAPFFGHMFFDATTASVDATLAQSVTSGFAESVLSLDPATTNQTPDVSGRVAPSAPAGTPRPIPYGTCRAITLDHIDASVVGNEVQVWGLSATHIQVRAYGHVPGYDLRTT